MRKKLTKKSKILIVIASVLCLAIVVVGLLGMPYSKYSLSSELKIPADADLNQKIELIDEWLWKLHNEGKFNGAVLVAKEGKILFDKTYGYTDVERKTRLTNQSSFNLASVSKQFTAMTIMILAEQGKLNYDDPVNRYLPELSYPDITIRHLLHHTSGLEDFEYLADKYWNENKIFANEDLLQIFQKNQPKLAFKPGDKYEYSNTGYIALATIVSRVSGVSFEQFLHDNIFSPLEMTGSAGFTLLSDPNSIKNRVYGFDGDESADLICLDGVIGDGNIYSSTSDFLKWDQALYTEKLVSSETLKEAFTPSKLNNGKLINYGFGWRIVENSKVYHYGKWVGFRTLIERDLKNHSLIVVLSNSSVDGDIFRHIVSTIKSHLIDE